MMSPTRGTMILSTGGSLSLLTAGDRAKPALLLIHGFSSSSQTFRGVIASLSEVAFVVAPDMPGLERLTSCRSRHLREMQRHQRTPGQARHQSADPWAGTGIRLAICRLSRECRGG